MSDELPRKRRGRPPLDPNDPSVQMHFRMPAKEYDAMAVRALRDGKSLSDYIRQRLRPDVSSKK